MRMKLITAVMMLVGAVLRVNAQPAMPSRVNFEGRWNLDMKRSKDLPLSFQQVKGQILSITQSEDSLIIMNELMSNSGDVINFPPAIYALDGAEVFREDTLRHSKRWMTTQWTTNNQKVVVTSRVEQDQSDPPQKYEQTDVWQLTNRNRLLVLTTQKFAANDSTRMERRVYNRIR